jgi:hypothetical protein
MGRAPIAIACILALALAGYLLLRSSPAPHEAPVAVANPPTPVAASAPTAPPTKLVNPNEILFSQPTLCDLLPPTLPDDSRDSAAGNPFVVREDDWRQVELVARADHSAVLRMLDEVRASEAANRSGPGWKNVYIRKEHPTPIAVLGIRLDDLKAAFPGANDANGIALTGGVAPARVRGGFALTVPGLGTIYGSARDGLVITLGLAPRRGAITASGRSSFETFCRAHELETVDWERRDWFDADK